MKTSLKITQIVLFLCLSTILSCKKDCLSNFSLSGEWQRVESSNSSLNGMTVNVNEDETLGTITSSPDETTFPSGAFKWKNIIKIDDYSYSFQDRLGGGTYTESKMFILANGNEIILSKSENNVSVQRWQKK